ncbi:chromate transport protein ChrA [Longilinea arvoryzae]|uniref:Chromate transport protein ChrA n=1 Tax=Longilinea arvoryzae TaxID=360412 RepID=A0A0S7BC23_9CHLR|nr:chromate transporter [Longilinea arvoryzae]GAP12829.1 chromate transport protein ChrA [Longilinea arvoryzae]
MPPRYSHSLREIFSTFLVIGLQSFGGGTATFYLIHQACLKRGWLSEEEFLKYWALAQITPGIGLAKMTCLLGKRLHGWAGIAAALSGLMLPSAAITALMTAGYNSIQNQPLVKAAMRGILPATIGLTLALSWDLGSPLLIKARRDGRAHLSLVIFLILGAAALFVLAQFSPILILLIAGGLAIASRTAVQKLDREKIAGQP